MGLDLGLDIGMGLAVQQTQRFALVGGDQGRTRQEQGSVGLHHRVVGKRPACGRAQDRIDHQGQRALFAQAIHPLGHHFNLCHTAQQTGLDGPGWQVLRQGLQLGLQQFGRHRHHGLHPHGVLRGDGGHHRAQVHPKGLGGTPIGGQACATTAVVARDAPDNGGTHASALTATKGHRPPACWPPQSLARA